MRRLKILFIVLIAGCISCKKESREIDGCDPSQMTTRQLVDGAAVVQLLNGKYYIVENGTIDSKLLPCSLAPEFQQDDLNVIVSGDIKGGAGDDNEICCTNYIVISEISR